LGVVVGGAGLEVDDNTNQAGATPVNDGRAPDAPLADLKGIGNRHHFLAGGQACS
jgi:hypothetical protein